MPKLPSRYTRPPFPMTVDGTIFEHIGKYARGAVLYAFEELGGPQALAEWAEDNPDEFYLKLFPRIITKETEVSGRGGGPVEVVIRAMTGDE